MDPFKIMCQLKLKMLLIVWASLSVYNNRSEWLLLLLSLPVMVMMMKLMAVGAVVRLYCHWWWHFEYLEMNCADVKRKKYLLEFANKSRTKQCAPHFSNSFFSSVGFFISMKDSDSYLFIYSLNGLQLRCKISANIRRMKWEWNEKGE